MNIQWPMDLQKDPRPMRLVDGVSVDREIALSSPCGRCGGSNMQFDYQYIREPYSYRAFAYCGDCGKLDEF